MAKSLRSKPKLRAKSVKRNGEFAKLAEARSARLAEKLKANLDKQKEDQMEETEAADKKVATSGWRSSSRRRMKQKRSKRNTTKF